MKTGKYSRRSFVFGGATACVVPQLAPAQERQAEGGIGGTGIVGVLTDFGSLIVGGQLVETTARTEITDAFGPLSESALAIGDSLTVEAAGPAGALVARRVHVTYPVVGAVTAVSGGVAVINGVRVVLPATGPALSVGDRVAVSGVWRGRTVVASRISAARAGLDVVSGDVTNALRGTQVGGVAVTRSRLSGQSTGSFGTVVGTYDGQAQVMRVQSAVGERFFGAAGPLERLAVEGFLEVAPRRPGYRVSGLGHSFARTLDLAPFAEARTLFTGPYTGLFAANAARILPADTAQRRQLLRALATRA